MLFKHCISMPRVLIALAALALQGLATAADYIIQAEDEIAIRVFQEDDLTTTGRVSKDGAIIMPLVGSIRVAGLTTHRATELVRAKLKDGYLVNPQVTVEVTKFDRKAFTILGQVSQPDTYYIPGGKSLSLLQAIGVAGGCTRIANKKSVTLRRAVPDANGVSVFQIDLSRLISGKGGVDFTIRPGDIITIPERLF